MIIVMRSDAQEDWIEEVVDRVKQLGGTPHIQKGKDRCVIGIIGGDGKIVLDDFRSMSGVLNTLRVSHPFKISGREFHPDDTVINVKEQKIGKEITIV